MNKDIIHHLIINTPLLKDIGLLTGKMGISIAFYEMSRREENDVYSDYAGDLLDQVFDEISIATPIDFSTGLSGIGWGIEYLIQNKFIEGDSLEACEDIDNKLISIDPRRINDFSLEKGLYGILHYVLMHCKGCKVQKNRLPFDKLYFEDLYYKINTTELSNSPNSIVAAFKNLLENNLLDYNYSITDFSKDIDHLDVNDLNGCELGINGGIASMLLKDNL